MDLQERLNQKLDYLNSIYDKYYELNQKTKFAYEWRLSGLENQILALEELRNNENLNKDWDICLNEDIRESQR